MPDRVPGYSCLKCVLFLVVWAFFLVESFAQNPIASTVKKINPGKEINTEGQEYAPVISADGLILFFTSRRIIGNPAKGRLSMETVYGSQFDTLTGKWSTAEPLDKVINQPGRHNSAISLSNDGQKMLLYRDDASGNGDIYLSVLQGRNWSTPQSLGNPVCSRHHESSASYGPDGRTLYFVSDRPGGVGGRDIWIGVSGKDGRFKEVRNAPAPLNSAFDEESVFMHPDGKTLYFSSNRPGGLGGFDLYRSELKNGIWSSPVNLGSGLNTEGDEMYFVSDASGKRSFISSAGYGSLGMQDIFMLVEDLKQDSSSRSTHSLCLLKGMVKDASTGLPLDAYIEVVDNNTGQLIAELGTNSASGQYLISLPSGINYGIRVNAKDYLFYSENIQVSPEKGFNELRYDIPLERLEAGKKVVLKNIFYDFNSTELSLQSKAELTHLIELLNRNPRIRVEIASHTDDKGTDEYNQKLSSGRAEAVVSYLRQHGIAPDRLQSKGYGESLPLVPNDTPEHQAMNRRTEFIILSDSKPE